MIAYFRYYSIVYLTLIPKIYGSEYLYVTQVQHIAFSGFHKVTYSWLFQGHMACNLCKKSHGFIMYQHEVKSKVKI